MRVGTSALAAADSQRREQPTRLEQRWGEAVREPPRVLQGLPHVASHVREARLRRRGICVHRSGRELQAGGEPDQLLLHVVVEGALEVPALGVVGNGQPPPGRAQLVDLAAQLVELPHRVGSPLPQDDPPPAPRSAR